jgi:hypothetical protein
MPPEVVSEERDRVPTFRVPEMVEDAPFTTSGPET